MKNDPTDEQTAATGEVGEELYAEGSVTVTRYEERIEAVNADGLVLVTAPLTGDEAADQRAIDAVMGHAAYLAKLAGGCTTCG